MYLRSAVATLLTMPKINTIEVERCADDPNVDIPVDS
jgi:hypothetical protein